MRSGLAAGSAMLIVAGCAGTGGWSKPGVDAAATASEYRECRDLAASAVKTDADIDQDIRATRGADWQRSDAVRVETRMMQDTTTDRADRIIGSCMHAKGFTAAR